AGLFGGELDGLGASAIGEIFADVPSTRIARSMFAGGGMSIIDLLVDSGVASSKGEARRAVEGGGVYVNNRRVDGIDRRVEATEAVDGRYLVLRKGKRSYHLVELVG